MSQILIVMNSDCRMKYMKHYLETRLDINKIDDELQLFYGIDKKNCECLILPVKGVNKDFVIDGTDIKLTDNYLQMLRNKRIYTGLINEDLKKKCQENNILLISYLTEDLAIKNNYITTEGIINNLVTKSEKAIYNSRILIIGYGKLGQISANVLKAMKADITISCRHEKDLLHGKINDFKVIPYSKIITIINQFDFIINTIPYRILDNTILKTINNNEILIIDVSSNPFGLDHDYAKQIGLNSLLLPGLPGIVAPQTAGELIGAFIYQDIVGGEI